jgi:hypothetical protein
MHHGRQSAISVLLMPHEGLVPRHVLEGITVGEAPGCAAVVAACQTAMG